MPTAPVTSWGEALLTSLAAALAIFLGAIPKVIGFLVILIIGWIVASALAGAVAALLRAVKFNDLAERSGLAGFVQKMGMHTDSAGMIALIAKWFVRLIVLVVAFDALGLPAVSQVLQQLLLWLPNLVVALVVLVIAGLAANALGNLVRGATAEAGLGSPDLLAIEELQQARQPGLGAEISRRERRRRRFAASQQVRFVVDVEAETDRDARAVRPRPGRQPAADACGRDCPPQLVVGPPRARIGGTSLLLRERRRADDQEYHRECAGRTHRIYLRPSGNRRSAEPS